MYDVKVFEHRLVVAGAVAGNSVDAVEKRRAAVAFGVPDGPWSLEMIPDVLEVFGVAESNGRLRAAGFNAGGPILSERIAANQWVPIAAGPVAWGNYLTGGQLVAERSTNTTVVITVSGILLSTSVMTALIFVSWRDRTRASARVFVSYRRNDSRTVVERLTDRLRQEFPPGRVFRDTSSNEGGIDFPTKLLSSIRSATVVLTVIGPDWVAKQSDGTTRLGAHGDWVRVELETALAAHKPILPVLLEGASLPALHEVPETLIPLLTLHALPLRGDPDFERDVPVIVQRLIALSESAPHEQFEFAKV
jgi:hypothetical protein